jgi:hypothetical protein
MTDAARFLRDLLLHPRLRTLAERDLDAALTGYDVTDAQRELLRAQDPALLDLYGEAVRQVPGPARPAAVERLERPATAQLLDPADLWLRLHPYATDDRILYSVGLAPGDATDAPPCPPLTDRPLPPIDLDIRVQPTVTDGQLAYTGSMLPRGRPTEAPTRARRHAPPDAPHVRRAALAAWEHRTYAAVLDLLDAITTPGEPAPDGPDLPSPPDVHGPHVSIVGLGICSPDDITRTTERALRRARHVLYADPSLALPAWLATCCPRITPLLQTYVQGDTRLHTYHHMAAATLHAALHEAPVVFAMSGHPLVGAYAPFLLLDAARALGFKVEVHAGITALDRILALLEVDPILTGLQMVEATELLLQARPLHRDMPTLVWQIGTVGTQLHSDHRRTEAELAPLRDHLLRFHPAEHVVSAVYASPHPHIASRILDVPLADLATLAPELHAGFSLWVPASVDRPLADPALHGRLYDPDALGR